LLTRQNWESAGLCDIVIDALEPFGVSEARAERLVITGDNFRVAPKVSLALSIAFNELATNAVKYGAFSNEAGSIEIIWRVEPSSDGEQLHLTWKEKDGPEVSTPTRKGFGLQVVERGLAQELEGAAHLDFKPAGLVFTLSFPAGRVGRDG
jgi:two-component sensor histidine kinase